MALKKIFLNLRKGEWKVIDQRIVDSNKSDLSSFLRSEIPKLKKRFETTPSSFPEGGKRTQRAVYITEDSYQNIKEIADYSNKPVATIITELFLNPLLRP